MQGIAFLKFFDDGIIRMGFGRLLGDGLMEGRVEGLVNGFKLFDLETLQEFHQLVERIRERQGERESSVPTAMIRIPNGPVERW